MMLVVMFAVMVIGAAWYYSMVRGRLTVRAICFLQMVEDGETKDEANAYAMAVDAYLAAKLKNEAMLVVNEAYGGSQLSAISLARIKGFRG